MSTDPSVVAAIESAVAGDPENIALRLHLASMLLESGRPGEVLNHCSQILGSQPDNTEALDLAARAAAASGDQSLADRYRRLHQALAGGKESPARLSGSPSRFTDPPPETSATPDEGADENSPVAGKVIKMRVIHGGAGADDFADTEQPGITLADVAGMDEVKRRLNLAFLAPMKNPEVMKMYGKSVRGGLLLYGPPGCGKTFIARATAGELGAKFISIGLQDVLDMWLGQSERNLHEIFETARRTAPCVLFLDEIDALGRKRSLVRHSAVSNVINQLLAEMDSLQGNNKGLFVLAATNHPWDVDTGLRRPGRLDRTLLVLPPDRVARQSILQFHLRDRPVKEINLEWLADRTDDFSGADLAHLCESAAEVAMEESLATGNARPIGMADFNQALRDVRPSTRPWFDTARNYAMFANEGGVYDDLLNYLRAKRLL